MLAIISTFYHFIKNGINHVHAKHKVNLMSVYLELELPFPMATRMASQTAYAPLRMAQLKRAAQVHKNNGEK
ncbi:MAG: hypothetical protein LEGION0398_MBIBDBAK_00791 [Legionellaceae bacterium]